MFITNRFTRSALLLACVAASALATGCATDRSRSGFLEPYRFAIPQGNYINQEMLDEVKEGMSREQVRLAIGTPLLVDVFHPDRWDYVFRFKHPNGDAELRRVIVFFTDERVSEIRADKLPATDDPNDPALPGYQPSQSADT
ncbi:MAG: outer membrane protein assembly factor BamE [Lautropia sp.]|nr:outer membrane protein assembly factor BamE [Lautropia sp.]